MGLMDRLKGTAQDVASEARKAGVQAQEKLEEVKSRRKTDETARRLGYLVYRERTAGTPAGSDADALVNEMRELEEQEERRQQAAREQQAEQVEATDASPEGADDDLMEETQPGAPPPQSPPEGQTTDQDSN
ncbi:MAG: hypothetical protein ABR529_07840 [Actinomycetota bacterium]